MILDNREIELLRLAAKYRWLPFSDLDVYSERGMKEIAKLLSKTGHIGISRNKIYIKPTPKGYSYLNDIGYPYEAPARRAYANSTTLRRRLETSEIMLTCHRAGIDTLRDDVDALADQPVFLPAFDFRTIDANVMSNAKCAGFGHFGNKAYMFHYVNEQNGGMYMINETGIFHNLSSVFSESLDKPKGGIFAGPNYREIFACLSKTDSSTSRGIMGFFSFAEVYRQTVWPIHLLSCDEVGAIQLALMRQPDYNAKIAQTAFGGDWSPPDKEIPFADGSIRGDPLVIAADMNIRRIQKVCKAIAQLGKKRVLIAAFQSQLDSLLWDIFPSCDLFKHYAIDRPVLDAAFPGEFSLKGSVQQGDDNSA
jgi:hypothetical protein